MIVMPYLPFLFGHKKENAPIPHIPTMREVAGMSGYLQSVRDYDVAMQELENTFTPEQMKLYSKVRETGQKCLMLKPVSLK